MSHNESASRQDEIADVMASRNVLSETSSSNITGTTRAREYKSWTPALRVQIARHANMHGNALAN